MNQLIQKGQQKILVTHLIHQIALQMAITFIFYLKSVSPHHNQGNTTLSNLTKNLARRKCCTSTK